MKHNSLENDPCLNIMGDELGIGPVISQNICKVLDECIRNMVVELPPSTKEKDKDRVRRPMNAFMIYSQNARKAMAKHYPTLSYRKLSKALGKIWKALDPEEKKPFEKEAERRRILHKKKHPDYKFTSYKKQNKNKDVPRVAQKAKSGTECLPKVEDLIDLIQRENLSQQLGSLTEIGSDQTETLSNSNVFGETKNTATRNTLIYNTLKPKLSLFAPDLSLQMGPSPTWAAFGARDECIPSPTVDPTLETCNDQELLSLLNSILNDTTASFQANTSTTPQFPAQNVALPVGYLNVVGQDVFAPSNQFNNGTLTSSCNDSWNPTLPSDLSTFFNFQQYSSIPV